MAEVSTCSESLKTLGRVLVTFVRGQLTKLSGSVSCVGLARASEHVRQVCATSLERIEQVLRHLGSVCTCDPIGGTLPDVPTGCGRYKSLFHQQHNFLKAELKPKSVEFTACKNIVSAQSYDQNSVCSCWK